jgi:hypothetical protein
VIRVRNFTHVTGANLPHVTPRDVWLSKFIMYVSSTIDFTPEGAVT